MRAELETQIASRDLDVENIPIQWEAAAAESELWGGDVLDVEVGGEQVLLVAASGQPIRAFQGVCPHQEVLLADGDWDPERGVLICAGHAWELDLCRGETLNPAGCQLYEYPVRVREGQIEVGIVQDGRRHYRRFLEGKECGE